jgi:uncharacterized protein
MHELTFEWDEDKAIKNLKKHHVSFEEAKTVFNDPFLLTCYDPNHSLEEHRFLSIGVSTKNRILVVCHTDRDNIRIISCRKAKKRESIVYEKR